MQNATLRALVDLRDRQIQKARIQFNNRFSAIERGDDPSKKDQEEIVARWLDVFETLEKQVDKDIASEVAKFPIFKEMIQIKGLGPLLSAKILSMVDIEIATHCTKLRKYAGYGMGEYWLDSKGDTKAPKVGYQYVNKEKKMVAPKPQDDWRLDWVVDKPIKGWVLPYNKRLKTTLYVLASSFLQSHSPYSMVYRNEFNRYIQSKPEWGKCKTCDCPIPDCETPELHSDSTFRTSTKGWATMHIHLAATRRMIILFLSHFWERYRIVEGLPVTKPYVIDKLGHESYIPPVEFGWDEW